ncbi:MAG TPA: hypothetical protein VEI82_05550 [Myxococcota bacterium]|nr:hypothetical protein [Myxococcota bacterium]
MPRKHPLAAALAALHWAALALVWGRLAEVAWLRFPLDWDFLAYQLPGALQTYGLTSYTPEPRLVAVIAGFPPLPRAIEGAFVLATGRFSTACALNLVAIAMLVAGLAWLHGRALSLRWLGTALLGVPLVVLHAISGYVDLFTGSALALAFAAFVELEPGATRPRAGAALLVAALATAQLSKFQAWPIGAVVGAVALFRLAAQWRAGRLSRRATLGLLAALVLALGAWPLRNLVEFHNPVYPVVFPIAPKLFPNASVDADSGVYNMPVWLADAPRAERFLVSALELSRFRSGERFEWTIDQSAQADASRSPHHRLGGWFWWTVAALALGSLRAVRARLVPRSAQLAFALSIAVVALLPQSHELRYWLFIPLVLAQAAALALASPALGPQRGLRAGLCAGAAFVLFATRPFAIDARPPAELAPERAQAFWAAQRAQPRPEPVRVCNVNPNGIFYAGPTFREFRVVACFGDP